MESNSVPGEREVCWKQCYHYLSDGRDCSFETGKTTSNDLCLFAPSYSLNSSISLSLSLLSTSSRHTFSPLHSHVSSSLHNPSPADLFRNTKCNPLALLTCIKCLHSDWGLWKRLPLRRSQGTQSVKHADLDALPNTCDMNWPVRWWSKQNEGASGGYRLRRPILILKMSH